MNDKMELVTWAGGLQLQEIEALDKIQAAFVPKIIESKPNVRGQSGGSLASQLGKAFNKSVANGMYPWKGYAGFRFVDSRGYEGEFDLVLITHDRVLIIELKELKGRKITCDEDKWFCDDYEKYRSPVSVTQNKVYLLKNKLEKIRHKFSNKKMPWVDFLVILSNNNDYSELPDQQKRHVMGINEFLKLSDESKYQKHFNSRVGQYRLSSDISVFDGLLNDGSVKPKHLSVQNYTTTVDDRIFPLDGQDAVYSEYIATSEANKNDKALLRQWDFNKVGDAGSRTSEGRYKIVSHERDVLIEIKNQSPELYRYCLQPKTNPTSEEVTRQFHELYDLPADNQRFNEYINQYVETFDEADRITLVQVLINQFADLHLAHIAHRDIGDHSLWLSPSKKVSLSSFISAYYKPLGTVGERREKLSVGVIPLPEDGQNEEVARYATPFHRDVYALGIVAQLIMDGSRVTKNNIDQAVERIAECTAWYGDVFRKAVNSVPTERYKDAVEFRDALSQAKPEASEYVLHTEEQLDIFRKKLNPYKTYPVDNELKDGEDKEVYQSAECIVRLWSDVNPSIEQPDVFQACLDFLNKADRLKGIDSHYLARIEDFGIAPKTSQLFLVQEYIVGLSLREWLSQDVCIEDRRDVIQQIFCGVEHLHNIDIFHGDLHPENIIISGETGEYAVRFIDYLDFSRTGGRVRNHRYSPEYIDSSTAGECDNYAVMRIASEVLSMDWDNLDFSSNDYPLLVAAINEEFTGAGSFLSLERFKNAFFETFLEVEDQRSIEVCLRSDENLSSAVILPDNDELFLHVVPANEPRQIKLHISGIGGSIDFFYDLESREVRGNLSFRENETASPWERDNSQLVSNFRLSIRYEKYRDYSELNEYLQNLDGFDAITEAVIAEHKQKSAEKDAAEREEADKEEVSQLVEVNVIAQSQPEGIEHEPILSEQLVEDARRRPTPQEIWRALIETEVDALPMITVTEKPAYDERLGLVKLQYSSSENFIEQFSSEDEVELLKKVDDREFSCGKLDVKESNSKFLYLKSNSGKTKFNIDDIYYLRTNSERSSFIRRKKAVNRVLEKTSVIPDLIDYFGACDSDRVIEFSKPPTAKDFEVYDRDDGHGGTISLNDQQRAAFSNLVSTGPVSLLQGPPGTGKTEFIAAFTHYLINKEGAKHILLVSQSHEAVNTAAERIRSHCSRHGSEIDVVRFSNKSSNISAGLVDAYSVYLVEERLEQFRAQFSERINALQGALKLPADYIQAVVDKELTLSKRLRALKQINSDIADDNLAGEERERLIKISESILEHVKSICLDVYGVSVDSSDINEAGAQVDKSLSAIYSVAPNESKRMRLLIELMHDYQERLETNPGSYEEFLARSRTLVCGTCVGMGLGHLSVRENQYDWVIIDEAARSVSSELAIAMQSGKRVLLVGDHKQLPPTYQEEHKTELSRRLKLDKHDPEFEWVLKSDFERAFESSYGKLAGSRLLVQYRMAEPIGNMVSDIFYRSELKTGDRHIPDIYKNLPVHLASPVTWLDTSSLGDMAKSQTDKNHSSFNAEEAHQIIQLLKQLEAKSEFIKELSKISGDEPAIGVICMYAAQKRLLFRKFNEIEWSDEFRELVKIDTVDSYQGKENRIIIVSTTLNTHDKNPRFLKVLNRINVAMSRAMDRLLIVGATEMWRGRNGQYPLGQIAAYMQEHQGDEYRFVKAKAVQKKGGKKNAKR